MPATIAGSNAGSFKHHEVHSKATMPCQRESMV
jgi:hypothetical protein